MKKFIFCLFTIFICAGLFAQQQGAAESSGTEEAAANTGYNIGDRGPGGGFVFFAENGAYLECSADIGTFNWNRSVREVKNYRGGDFTDWRLPTRAELDLIYQNLKKTNTGGFSNDRYWSSAEYLVESAWNQNFGSGKQDYSYKTISIKVLAVRAF